MFPAFSCSQFPITACLKSSPFRIAPSLTSSYWCRPCRSLLARSGSTSLALAPIQDELTASVRVKQPLLLPIQHGMSFDDSLVLLPCVIHIQPALRKTPTHQPHSPNLLARTQLTPCFHTRLPQMPNYTTVVIPALASMTHYLWKCCARSSWCAISSHPFLNSNPTFNLPLRCSLRYVPELLDQDLHSEPTPLFRTLGP